MRFAITLSLTKGNEVRLVRRQSLAAIDPQPLSMQCRVDFEPWRAALDLETSPGMPREISPELNSRGKENARSTQSI